MTTRTLPIHHLCDRHPGVTAGPSESYSEAARVCLDRHHVSPIEFVIERSSHSLEVLAEWAAADERTRRAWANETDATEAGAYGLALAALETTDGLVAVGRAETKTGADYYLGPVGSSPDDFEQCYRLEVSGVNQGTMSTIKCRLRQKINQAASGKSSLPAIAAVVGFAAKTILASDVELK